MSKMAKLRLGASSILLTLGLVWMPVAVSAASEGPSAQAYSDYEAQAGANSCTSLYFVTVGDTLTKIAAAYGVTIDALAEENGLDDTNLIRLDQALCIPEATHGPQASGYAKPGESYDPQAVGYGAEKDTYNQQGSGYAKPGANDEYPENGDRPEEDSYYPQGSSYAKPGESYDPQAVGYGAEENSYHQQESGYAKPGQSYEPQAHGDKVEENGYGYDLKPGESAWALD